MDIQINREILKDISAGITHVKPVIDTKGLVVITARDTVGKAAFNGKSVLVPKFTKGTVIEDSLNVESHVKVRFNTIKEVESRIVMVVEDAVLMPVFPEKAI